MLGAKHCAVHAEDLSIDFFELDFVLATHVVKHASGKITKQVCAVGAACSRAAWVKRDAVTALRVVEADCLLYLFAPAPALVWARQFSH